MANNLRRFQTEAQYSAATLNYPAVSWVVEGDGIHFDKASQVNDKLMFCFNSGTDGALNIVAWKFLLFVVNFCNFFAIF